MFSAVGERPWFRYLGYSVQLSRPFFPFIDVHRFCIIILFQFYIFTLNCEFSYSAINRTLSRHSDQGTMVAMLGVARPNQFCKFTIGLHTTFYIVMCAIYMTIFDKGGVNTTWLGGRIFQGGIASPYGVAR